MNKKRSLILKFVISIMLISIRLNSEDPNFGSRIDMGLVKYDNLREASGIAASKKNKGVLWTHNDSGDKNRIYALNSHGEHLGIYNLYGITTRDLEDIAVGPGPIEDENYIYLGDIGDNDGVYNYKYIYRIKEPEVDSSQSPVNVILYDIETIQFQYPDEKRDAETIFLDPVTKDLFIISKREDSVKVYCAPYPQSTSDKICLDHVATLNISQVVGGDISHLGNEILIKNYFFIYYWFRSPGQNISDALMCDPFVVNYIPEPQGEGICWDSEGEGYFTISEERWDIPAHIYYYPRITETSVKKDHDSSGIFKLENNYPNPCNPNTKIRFIIPEKDRVLITVFNSLGRAVETLFNQELIPGSYEIDWNTANYLSGSYYYRLQAGNRVEIGKCIVIK